jgi:HlyD family secretion protein
MKRFLVILLILLILAGIAVLISYFVYHTNEQKQELILYGNVDVRQVDISFRVAGQVDRLFFEEGDVVKAGALMATLKRDPYQAQVSQSQANVESARASYENAEKLYKRRQGLVGIGGVSQEDLETATSNHETTRANLAAAEAAWDVAKSNLSYVEVYAPTDGIILSRVREPGSVVNPSDPVYTLSVSSPVWIRAYVSEVNLGQVYFGMSAQVTIDTPHAPIYHGKVGFISPVAEFTPKAVETTSLRTDLVYRLRIYIDNPDHILKQGMPVTVKLKLREKGDE